MRVCHSLLLFGLVCSCDSGSGGGDDPAPERNRWLRVENLLTEANDSTTYPVSEIYLLAWDVSPDTRVADHVQLVWTSEAPLLYGETVDIPLDGGFMNGEGEYSIMVRGRWDANHSFSGQLSPQVVVGDESGVFYWPLEF
jgi:hypothetical protein